MKTIADTRVTSPGQLIVSVSDSFEARIRAGKHILVVDEPEAMGGTNNGPSPQELILASLGSCAAITLRMYADRKAWPLTKIDVKLQFEGEPEKENMLQPNIKMQILVQGNLNEEQVTRLAVIAEKCPVHKSLSAAFNISTKLARALPEFS